MAMPTEKVELGFDESGPGNFFILDDAVQGVLDNTGYVLGGGSFFYDVSAYVTQINTARGKSRALDRYQAGHVTVRSIIETAISTRLMFLRRFMVRLCRAEMCALVLMARLFF